MTKIQCEFEGDISWFIEKLSELGAEEIEEIENGNMLCASQDGLKR